MTKILSQEPKTHEKTNHSLEGRLADLRLKLGTCNFEHVGLARPTSHLRQSQDRSTFHGIRATPLLLFSTIMWERLEPEWQKREALPKQNPRVLIRALLQMTIDTEEITERLRALKVPSWTPYFSAILESLGLAGQEKVRKAGRRF
jgi:hypothetical protein